MHARFLYFALTLTVFCSVFAFCETTLATQFEIKQQDNQWILLKNEDSFYINGAVGGKAPEMLRAYGGNAVRIRANQRSLDQAHEHNLYAMVNLPVRGERNGMDWDNQTMVNDQKENILQIVQKFKNHPALMFWSIGNELDHIPSGEKYNPDLWIHLNDIAREIKKMDQNHPVLTVIGSGRFEQKIQLVAKHCADMDLLGINSYGDLDKVTELIRQYWPKPYVVAEWGPTGHWQVPKTEWRVPIEQTSTEKAQVISHRYTTIIQQDKSHCLGSFVFYWAEKQETTHTWYGLFRDGMKTESIDVMKYHWSGSWPENRAPAVLDVMIDGFIDKSKIYLKPNSTYSARVFCYDCDYDELSYQWDIRPEVEIPKNSYAGGLEKPAKPIPGLILKQSGQSIQFQTPADEGAYRLFIQVTDGHENAGYGNAPFYVKN